MPSLTQAEFKTADTYKKTDNFHPATRNFVPGLFATAKAKSTTQTSEPPYPSIPSSAFVTASIGAMPSTVFSSPIRA